MTWKSNKFVFAPRDSHKVKRVSCHMNSTVLILTNTKDCTCFLEKVLLLWCLSLILCLSSVTGKVLRPDPRLQRPNWAEPSLHAATQTARSPAVASVSELTCIYCDGGQDRHQGGSVTVEPFQRVFFHGSGAKTRICSLIWMWAPAALPSLRGSDRGPAPTARGAHSEYKEEEESESDYCMDFGLLDWGIKPCSPPPPPKAANTNKIILTVHLFLSLCASEWKVKRNHSTGRRKLCYCGVYPFSFS